MAGYVGLGLLTGTVIVEERVKTCSVHEDGLRADDAKTPRIGAVTALALAQRHEVRVVELLHGWEGDRRIWVGLVVSESYVSLGL